MSKVSNKVVLGITGGIGSGKSLVCKILELFGVPVYDSDHRAKWVMTNNEELILKVKTAFGKDSYLPDGSLNRPYIGNIVFKDKSQLEILNGIVHPIVAKDFKDWLGKQTAPVVAKEAAILIESGAYNGVDKIVVVNASKEVRISRVMKRDGIFKDEVENRISKQLSDEERNSYADYLIDNSGEKMLIPQVQKILESFTS